MGQIHSWLYDPRNSFFSWLPYNERKKEASKPKLQLLDAR
jgi:hypothetical protein